MSESYDCIVLGVGGFGSGALYHLASRGARVLGIERFGVPHDRGSSHGETRIIRKAYFEHPDYVPLLLEAYELWGRLEREVGRQLYHPVGLMLAGPPAGEAISGALLSARRYGLHVEEIPPGEARNRFPGFRIPADFAVVFEGDAGFLDVEECVRAHVRRAVDCGAELRTDESVLEWSVNAQAVNVQTDKAAYEAERLVITAGPWARDILNGLAIPLKVVRKVMYWHETKTRAYGVPQGTPAFYFEMPEGAFYGFPSIDGKTVKVAEHTGGQPVDDPLLLDRTSRAEDQRAVREFVRQALPGVLTEPARHSVCMYTNTPDHHFVLDRHPHHPNVLIAAGFSGHGFKFTGVLGEALAELALSGATRHPVDFLGLNREALKPRGGESKRF